LEDLKGRYHSLDISIDGQIL